MGHNPGVYEEWVDAKEQIDGVKGPKYKKFATREEAEAFVKEGGKANKKAKTKTGTEKGKDEGGKKVGKGKGKGKGTVEDDAQEFVEGDTVKVWTDGSSRGNGKAGAVAGYGVFFGDGDARYIILPFPQFPPISSPTNTPSPPLEMYHPPSPEPPKPTNAPN